MPVTMASVTLCPFLSFLTSYKNFLDFIYSYSHSVPAQTDMGSFYPRKIPDEHRVPRGTPSRLAAALALHQRGSVDQISVFNVNIHLRQLFICSQASS
ncbi:hypothetical protein GALMADRAFT_497074 [Galerina marginata CBS 339.88]|uniref:Uncharacterized protein n=1 Tax=Galerina marginata (strain CBS 339.88) TaxID=685588 RepID=A0A067SXN5_GALM3|nr:hypothetical protein GALMADRAFT_497074 [Galerina marginata CBS 339.88]